MGTNEGLPLDALLLKVTVLLRIDLIARSSDLEKLYRSEIKWETGHFACRLLRPKEWRVESKGTNRQWSPWLVVYRYSKDARLCTYDALKLWLEKSAKLVKSFHVMGFTG